MQGLLSHSLAKAQGPSFLVMFNVEAVRPDSWIVLLMKLKITVILKMLV